MTVALPRAVASRRGDERRRGSTLPPRAVVLTRRSEYDELLRRHATREQARFFLEGRGQSIAELERRHERQARALEIVSGAVPGRWRRARVDRSDLSRFLFEPEDVVVVVGQDGLIANVAKYLDGQPVIGVNPDPERYDGVLVRHPPRAAARLLDAVPAGEVDRELRTMAEARTDDGQRLVALNEVFVGHRSHQSARYRIRWAGREERQSSSGLLITTGTGATGWARSITLQRRADIPLPGPCTDRLAFFSREPFPSVATGTSIGEGLLAADEQLEVISEMNDGGVIFGDGIEEDHLFFHWGLRLTVGLAPGRLCLI